jgi:hypothetical protein
MSSCPVYIPVAQPTTSNTVKDMGESSTSLSLGVERRSTKRLIWKATQLVVVLACVFSVLIRVFTGAQLSSMQAEATTDQTVSRDRIELESKLEDPALTENPTLSPILPQISTPSVIIKSATVAQTASTSTMRETPLASPSITQDSPEGFPLIDEFFTTGTETATATRPSLHSLLDNETGKGVQGAFTTGTETGTVTVTVTATATRPSLHSLLHNKTGKVVQDADISWLLDFAIIGFAKCGTSTVRFV